MKLTKKKIESIRSLLCRYSDSASHLTGQIVEIVESEAVRSPEQHRWYWGIFLPFCEHHTPDQVTFVLEIEHVSANTWHGLFKDAFGKESTAFASMEHQEFTEYLDNCKLKYAQIIGCSVIELTAQLEEVK